MKTTQKKLAILAMLTLLSVATLMIIYHISRSISNSSTHFVRQLPPHKIRGYRAVNVKLSNYYIAGVFDGQLYLGSISKPTKLLRVNLKTGDTTRLSVTAPDSLRVYKDCRFVIDSTRLFLVDGMKGMFCSGDLRNRSLPDRTDIGYYIKVFPLSLSTAIFKSIDHARQAVIVKKLAGKNNYLVQRKLLQKQIDGLFCTDGDFIRVGQSNQLIYAYYYRNQFFSVDTNLNLLYRAKTIDTVSHANFKVRYIRSENQWTISSPPKYVNKQISANQKFLFVWSALRADNESAEHFEHVSAIDVYDLKNGKYQFSLELPDLGGNKLRSFCVDHQSVICLYGYYVYQYKINF